MLKHANVAFECVGQWLVFVCVGMCVLPMKLGMCVLPTKPWLPGPYLAALMCNLTSCD